MRREPGLAPDANRSVLQVRRTVHKETKKACIRIEKTFYGVTVSDCATASESRYMLPFSRNIARSATVFGSFVNVLRGGCSVLVESGSYDLSTGRFRIQELIRDQV